MSDKSYILAEASRFLEIYQTVEKFFEDELDAKHGEGFCNDHRQWFDSILLEVVSGIYHGV